MGAKTARMIDIANPNPEIKKRKRVLVVDDETAILRIVSIGLRVFGFDVTPCTNGGEALKLVESEKPEIMILDLLMPGMNGFETLKKLRAVSDMPVIVFSAHSSARDEAMSLGANDFIAKPFHPEHMARKISALLKSDT